MLDFMGGDTLPVTNPEGAGKGESHRGENHDIYHPLIYNTSKNQDQDQDQDKDKEGGNETRSPAYVGTPQVTTSLPEPPQT